MKRQRKRGAPPPKPKSRSHHDYPAGWQPNDWLVPFVADHACIHHGHGLDPDDHSRCGPSIFCCPKAAAIYLGLVPRGSTGLPEEYDDSDPGGSDGEDGITDAPAPKAATAMLPSSIGLTFAVSIQATALQLTARWGRYERIELQDERFRKPDGSYRRVWKRVPMEGSLPPLPLQEGKLRATPPCPATPAVTICAC